MSSSSSALSGSERQRYSRHLLLEEVGEAGQTRLKSARVLLVGAGGLGSPCALYLAAAGVGTLGVVEHDRVDVSNLQRQVLYGTADVGRPKLEAARDRLQDLNPLVRIDLHYAWLTAQNALDLIRRYDLIVDGTDNFATRYLVNDACVLTGRPNVHASVFQFDGQASVFATAEGPCYRCLYPEPPPPGMVRNCAEGGVLGVLPGLLGTIQAVETLKLLLGVGESLAGRLLMVDALGMRFQTVQLARDPNCPACGTRELTALIDYDQFCGTPPLTTVGAVSVAQITPEELATRLRAGEPLAILDVREPDEVATGVIDGAITVPLGSLRHAAAEGLDALRAVSPVLGTAPELVLVCRSGVRSAEAVRVLTGAGVTGARSLAGGMLAWHDGGNST